MGKEAVTREVVRRYVSHWAFLPLSQFGDSDPISLRRRDFGVCSKTAMLVDALYPNDEGVRIPEDEVMGLDTVDGFVAWLEVKGVRKLNRPPAGYP